MTNNIREKIGIRIIHSTWAFYGSEFGTESWKNGGEGHCKRVHRNEDNSIDYEEDYYYSGRTFVDPIEGQRSEFLTIHYNYSTSRFSLGVSSDNKKVKSLINALRIGKTGWIGTSNAETLKIADAILEMWSLSRL